MTKVNPGWYRDPMGRHQHRYWTGVTWTEHVADDGVTETDPIPEEELDIPPAPETHQPIPPPPAVTVTQSNTTRALAGWLVALVAIVAIVVLVLALTGGDTTTTTLPGGATTPEPETTTTDG